MKFDEMIETVVGLIVNNNIQSNEELIHETAIERKVINHILEVLEHHEHIKPSESASDRKYIYHVSATLKRELD